ncbi:unnamed protein product [Staurois parvus]|uniref:Uncharacterized protein n=1 Tax=Staurois parvus TaxID=386267 RepID=A0ABN9HTG6_9NEOB|nr:unnamed protein product [Staurois parvus]
MVAQCHSSHQCLQFQCVPVAEKKSRAGCIFLCTELYWNTVKRIRNAPKHTKNAPERTCHYLN